MSKKDYKIIARVIAEVVNERGNHPSIAAVILRLSIAFSKDNPKFHVMKFIQACARALQ